MKLEIIYYSLQAYTFSKLESLLKQNIFQAKKVTFHETIKALNSLADFNFPKRLLRCSEKAFTLERLLDWLKKHFLK